MFNITDLKWNEVATIVGVQALSLLVPLYIGTLIWR